jgi:Glutaminyl-tRNA synthetase, non-specific RNA binding region part 1
LKFEKGTKFDGKFERNETSFSRITMAPKDKETEPSPEDLERKFKSIGLNDKLTKEALKSKLVRPSLDKTIDEAGVTHLDPATGTLILSLATATQKGTYENRPKIAKAIIDGRLRSSKQVEGMPLVTLT